MKDEIKEILNRFDFVKKEPNKLSYYPEDLLTREEMWLLYDYITNLEERKITKEDVDKYFEENMCVSFDKFIENWKEQEELTKCLQEQNKYFIKRNVQLHKKEKELLSDWHKEHNEAVNYKLRNEKAIEYINTHYLNANEPNLLNILQGSEKPKEIIDNGTMINVNNKNFHCSCGANVFTKYSDNTFECNGCGNEYEGSDKE